MVIPIAIKINSVLVFSFIIEYLISNINKDILTQAQWIDRSITQPASSLSQIYDKKKRIIMYFKTK